MTLSEAELAALDSGVQHIGVFFRLAVDPVLRLWLGVGDIEPGLNALEGSGVTYNGAGKLRDVPSLQQLINGQASRVTFTLSGVSDDILALAESADEVKLKSCSIGFAIMDRNWQLIGEVHWLWRGIADFLAMDLTGSADGTITKTAALQVGSQMTGRRRRGLSYFTDQDQQTRSPGDRCCERVTLYSQGVTKVWPRF